MSVTEARKKKRREIHMAYFILFNSNSSKGRDSQVGHRASKLTDAKNMDAARENSEGK